MNIIKNPGRDFWWKVASSCEYATFLQSPLWTELACRSHDNLRDATIGAILDSGTRVILPLVETPAGRGTMRTLQSTWNWSPGGVIADGPINAEEINELYRSLQSWRLSEGVFTGNPHSPLPDPPLRRGWESQEVFTQVLPLSGDIDSIIRGYSSAHRRGLKAARKAGVKVRRGSMIRDFEAYYKAYRASYDRWRVTWGPPLAWELFATCHQTTLEHPEKITLWLAEANGRLLSGGIFLYWNRGVVYWHGAGHQEFFGLYPNNLLHTEVIQDAILRGVSWYDFNPSAGLEGVARFKSGFGAQKKTFRRSLVRNKLFSAIKALAPRRRR